MDASTVETMLELVATQAAAITGHLVPIGHNLAISFVTLGVLFLSFRIGTGATSTLAPVVRFTGAAFATLWAIDFWPQLAREALEGARAVTGLIIPGYNGPGDLSELAMNLGERMFAEGIAWTWTAPLSSAMAAAQATIMPVVVVIGLSIPAMLAVLAEVQLMIGSALAPLVLPMLAWGVTASLGWGAVQFMVTQSIAVVSLAVMSRIIGTAIERVIQVPGSTDGLTAEDMWTLTLLAVVSVIAGWGASALARNLVGGSMGSLGIGANQRATGMVAGISNSFQSVGGSAAKAMISGGKGGSASTVARSASGSSSGQGSTPSFNTSSSAGSPFKP